MVQVRKVRDMGPLHGRLLRLCPPDTAGFVSISVLAKHLGLSSWSIYKWIHAGRVPPERVPDLLDLQRRAYGRVRVSASRLNPTFESR